MTKMDAKTVRSRAERCVCKQCGTKLEGKVVIYNRYGGSGLELYCPHCQKLEYGTEPEIYRLASDFVESVEFDYFTEMEEGQRRTELNIAKVCEMLGWIYRKTGILSSGGIQKDALNDFDYTD